MVDHKQNLATQLQEVASKTIGNGSKTIWKVDQWEKIKEHPFISGETTWTYSAQENVLIVFKNLGLQTNVSIFHVQRDWWTHLSLDLKISKHSALLVANGSVFIGGGEGTITFSQSLSTVTTITINLNLFSTP